MVSASYVSSPAGHLFAIDVTTGNIKWVYGIDAITYGGGALIGDDGTIYQCVESKDIDNVHAINSDGTKKWSIKLDDKIVLHSARFRGGAAPQGMGAGPFRSHAQALGRPAPPPGAVCSGLCGSRGQDFRARPRNREPPARFRRALEVGALVRLDSRPAARFSAFPAWFRNLTRGTFPPHTRHARPSA